MNLKFNISSKVNKDEVRDKLKEVLFNSMLKMHELATINAPVDTGLLRSSIILKPFSPGYTEYVLSDGVEYGVHMEYGTNPHYVSPAVLKDWARRVLGDENAAYPVAKKIAKFGVEAHPFFRPALYQVKEIWVKRYMAQAFRRNNNP